MKSDMMIESLEGRQLYSASFLTGGVTAPTTTPPNESAVVVAAKETKPKPPPPPPQYLKIQLSDVLISSYS